MSLANKYRPRVFSEVVGQEEATAVLKSILSKGWQPLALMITGPFGTGKTTNARLIARALLCPDRKFDDAQLAQPEGERGKPVEPCGVCESCLGIDKDNNISYTELDAASSGLISDVRAMKDMITYKTAQGMHIICYDESHMLTQQAQNALLQTLEEGVKDTLFIFATTDQAKMLPTIRSRCIELNLKLLSKELIRTRLEEVALAEGITLEGKAAGIIATYVRGHMRDALMLLEQLGQMTKHITELAVRTYLRLDRYDEIYTFLCLKDRREAVERLELLLCNYAVSELTESIGEILVNAYKVSVGIPNESAVDQARLKLILESRGKRVIEEAEQILSLQTDFATINYGMAAISRILFEDTPQSEVRRLMPGTGSMPVSGDPAPNPMRKPGKS